MRKIIRGKSYDTGTAAEVGSWDNGLGRGDFGLVEETLFRKRTGEYFLHGWGGPASKYARACGQSSWGSGERIMPLTSEAAMEWAEEHLGAEEYESEFGEVSEDGEQVVVSARVSPAAKRALEDEARRTGETMARVVERALLALAR